MAPPIGFALIVWVTRRAFPGAQGSGIPQTIAALSVPPGVRRHRLLSPRIAFGKVLFTVLALACGASVGREGPTVQVGASLMHALRRWARFPAVDVDRGLILAGGAALLSYASGLPGGIYAPSLSIGAAFGGELQPWLPSASGAAVVVLTMGAFFAGVVQAPLTALVIVLEMTSDRGLTLPLMAAIFIARAVSSLVCPEPLYRALSAPFLHAPGRRAPAWTVPPAPTTALRRRMPRAPVVAGRRRRSR